MRKMELTRFACASFEETAKTIYTAALAACTTVLGYFLPIEDIVNLLILFFVLDVIFGFWAARKLRGERFSVNIVWTKTIPRMIATIVLTMSAFMWDTVYNQTTFATYQGIGWFISGLLLFSIGENAYQITKWGPFKNLAKIFGNQIAQNTGFDPKKKSHKKQTPK